jgi:hypothetical protein
MGTPVYAASPQQYTVPQYAAPQYAMQQQSQPVYSEAGCGTPYVQQQVQCCPTCPSNMQYMVADPGCGYPMSTMSAPCTGCDVGYGGGYDTAVEEGQVMPSPAP